MPPRESAATGNAQVAWVANINRGRRAPAAREEPGASYRLRRWTNFDSAFKENRGDEVSANKHNALTSRA